MTAPILAPTSLAPGQSVVVWARFLEGPNVDLSPGLIRYTNQFWVRVAVLGIGRTVLVDLGTVGVAMTGTCA
jgi:hypothetical protein